jgi:hypothetical protein
VLRFEFGSKLLLYPGFVNRSFCNSVDTFGVLCASISAGSLAPLPNLVENPFSGWYGLFSNFMAFYKADDFVTN